MDDGSTDLSSQILAGFGDQIKALRIPQATGNKSYAQEFGLRYIASEVFVTLDADTLMDKNFIKNVEADLADSQIGAVGGYIRSLKHNWLTACRAIDYTIGQNLHKLAQSYINFMFVIPGTAGAFRTEIFKKYITFDHDTLTEDLDFTYKLHAKGVKIKYNREAVTYTQDPATLHSYINQMRRWYGGGWQNLIKHYRVVKEPAKALELSLIYIEGLIFSALLFLIPILNLRLALFFNIPYLAMAFVIASYASYKEKRIDLIFVFPLYLLLIYVNAWVFLEQFFKEILLRRKNLVWFHPDRVKI